MKHLYRPSTCLIVLATLLCSYLSAQAAPRPNILYLYVDDMGWGSIGPNGQADRIAAGLPHVLTPNIDRLADQGVNFSQAYGCTVCSPARSSQQSGFHQGHTYADRNNTDNAKKAMRADDLLMGDVLSAAGYVTGYWGKWGYGSESVQVDPAILNLQTLPTSHGYQHVLTELHHVRAHTFFQPTLWSAPAAPGALGGLELVPNSMANYTNNSAYPELPAYQSNPSYPTTAYCDDAYAFAALDFIRTQAQNYNETGQPFFGLLAGQVPHSPYDEIIGLPEWDSSYDANAPFHTLEAGAQAQQWAAMITRIDAHYGNLLAALEDPNNDGDTSDSVVENTIVIFQSDNGGPNNAGRTSMDANGGLRGVKGGIYDGGIRVPLIMRWPAMIHSSSSLPAGTESTRVVDVTDLLPTFCDLAGIETPLGIDGVSIVPLLTGTGQQRNRDFVIHEAGSANSIIRGKYKLVGSGELYDLDADHAEATNIASSHPDLVAELYALKMGERVTEPQWFANTYHHWIGTDGANASEAANWSDYTYSNTLNGLTYISETGAPRERWITSLANAGATDQTAVLDANINVLGIEIAGNPATDAEQVLSIVPGNTLTGRNEIRLSPLSIVELNSGTLASTRWVDLSENATIQGSGTIDAILYNAGTLDITTSTTTYTTNIIPGSGSGGMNIVDNGGFEDGDSFEGDADYSYNELHNWSTDSANKTMDAAKPTLAYAGTYRGLMQLGYNLVQDTGDAIQTGEVYQLDFYHSGFLRWATGESIDVKLFYKDGETPHTLFSFTLSPTPYVWNLMETNFPAITDPAAEGKNMWIDFNPNDSGYVSIDEVSLSIPGIINPPSTNIVTNTVSSAGVVVSNDYYQSTAALLDVPVSGAATSLVVNGTANLSGRLECSLPTGFTASDGDRFTIISAISVTGTFSNPDGMLEKGGHHFQIQYSADKVELVKVAVTTAGTPHWWMDLYGLTNDTYEVEDLLDIDGDRLTAWEEYIAGTLPTETSSSLTVEATTLPVAPGFIIQWPSTAGRLYQVHGSTNLATGFQPLTTGIPALPPQNTYTDSTTHAEGFYRVKTERE